MLGMLPQTGRQIPSSAHTSFGTNMDRKDFTTIIDGLQVAYAEWGLGKPILFLHGWGSSSDSWSKVADEVSRAGFRVLIPDLPGFGKTPPPPQAWGVGEYAAFVEEFARTLNIFPCILAGHSFGGQVAVTLASLRPERETLVKLLIGARYSDFPPIVDRLRVASGYEAALGAALGFFGGLFVGASVCHASRKFGDLNHIGIIFIRPLDRNHIFIFFVSVFHIKPPSCKILMTCLN